MGLSIGGIVCTITLKLLACPEKVPPPLPPIQAAQLDNDPAKVLELAQQLVATGTKPRNLIVFIADGMDPTLVAAARARIAQPAPLPLDQTLPPSAAPDAAAELDPSSAPMSAGGSAVAAPGRAVADPAAPVPVATARSDRLSFELFPATAVSKTNRESIEAHNYAGAVSSLLTGTETNPSIIGMDAKAVPDQCPKPAPPVPPEDPAAAPAKGKDSVATDSKDQAPALRENEVPTLLERATDAGFVAGFVSTSRVTAAAPAATYAHAANRNWETDSRMPQAALDAGCRDIARQLIEFDRHAKPDAKFDELAAKPARKASKKSGVVLDLKGLAARHGGLDVIMGGGRLAFLPKGMPDPVDPTRRGVRKPVGQGGFHLIDQWKERNPDGVLVTGASALEQNVQTAGPMLGLFSPDHMAFENDRMQQGVLNQIFLGRLMTREGGLSSLQLLKRADGSSMIDTAHLDYDGNSQGGIMGIMLAAVSPDIERAVFGVPGINYSLLLPRSVDFTSYEAIFKPAYPSELDRMIILDLLQMLWDRGEGGGYLQHLTLNPYPDTPAKVVLFDVAFGDWQVSELSAMIAARTIGLTIHRPVAGPDRSREIDPGYGLESTTYPSRGSAIIVWDSNSAPIPIDGVAPFEGRDPHEDPRRDADVRRQKAAFLFDDTLIDVCNGGVCTADVSD